MYSFNILLYNESVRILDKLKYPPKSLTYMTIYGKIYNYNGLKILKTNVVENVKNTVHCIVCTFDVTYYNYVFSMLDPFHMCSKYKYNVENPYDLSDRVNIKINNEIYFTWTLKKEKENKRMLRVKKIDEVEGRIKQCLGKI
jgi:hypothetical protein